MIIKKLPWDTNYFGINVAEIKDLKGLMYSSERLNAELLKNKIDLAYCISEKIIENSENTNSKYHYQYILKRLPLIKKMIRNESFHPSISIYEQDGNIDDDLVKLAQLTGRVGRFGKDKYVSSQQCDGIFKSLIVNSVNGDLATDILVYRENEKIVGFCTIKLSGDKGYVPIIGVLPEVAGSGIGFVLMQAIETYLCNKGCKYVVGGTQDTNKQAIKAFKRFGMSIGDPEYVYHIWNKEII